MKNHLKYEHGLICPISSSGLFMNRHSHLNWHFCKKKSFKLPSGEGGLIRTTNAKFISFYLDLTARNEAPPILSVLKQEQGFLGRDRDRVHTGLSGRGQGIYRAFWVGTGTGYSLNDIVVYTVHVVHAVLFVVHSKYIWYRMLHGTIIRRSPSSKFPFFI